MILQLAAGPSLTIKRHRNNCAKSCDASLAITSRRELSNGLRSSEDESDSIAIGAKIFRLD
jgi:hypothetical protein